MKSVIELGRISADSEFARIFEVFSDVGRLRVPDPLKAKVSKWYKHADDKGPEEAIARAEKQIVVRVRNRWTGEGVLFNERRAQRPIATHSDFDLEKFIDDARKNCDFCNPKDMTTDDVFGRIEGRHCITAANAAKYDSVHGLIVFAEHHPHHFGSEEMADYFATAQRWWAAARADNPELLYPLFVWNCLNRAGASLIHGHAQVLIRASAHYDLAESLLASSTRYAGENPGRNYFDDLVLAHRKAGLAIDFGDAAVLAYLTPKKEKEVVIIAPSLSDSLIEAVAKVLRCFIDELDVMCFNVGVLMGPAIASAKAGRSVQSICPRSWAKWDGFPVVARVVDRGALNQRTADVGGMEFYATPVVASDPLLLASKLRSAFA
ncbi:MAG: hypothetical protein QGD94_10285 [Planctomycetia bacterium]|nr:hypothetical protein [Planctomycetia bacterium]